jgi:hypothetical protein
MAHRKMQVRLASRSRISGGNIAVAALKFVFLAALLLLTARSWAQDNATINGTVSDPSGAVVPNAQIILVNPATSETRQATSNGAGAYRFANVGVGSYKLTATVSGFEKYTKTDIVVHVAQTVEENITLSVGSQGQTVTVQADSLQVQTETSDVSTLISGQQVSELSTNGRNITSLAALGLGVSNNLPEYGGIDALTSSNAITFNGTRQTHNIYMLDGAEQNDRGCGGCFMNLPSQDAIAEFQTLDSNYSPDYGVGSGGTILMVLKSGTHKYHGELYEFNRNTDYDAADYFSKTVSEFKLNEPGGNISGPLWIPHVYDEARNRTFFFWNEEWRKLIQGSSPLVINTIESQNFPVAGQDLAYSIPASQLASSTPYPIVPATTDPAKLALYSTDGLTAGQPFPHTPTTSTIPANLFDPNAVLEVNAGTFPKPNDGPSQYIASIPAPENIREDVVRIDHSINSKYQLMGHYLHDAMTKTFFPPLWGPANDYPTVGTAMTNPSYTAAIKLTQTYTPNLLNETAFLYSGNKITLTPIPGAGGSFKLPSGWTANSFFPVADNAGQDMPEIDIQGTPFQTEWTESYYPWKNGYEGFGYRDDLSWTRGRHQFKFGFSWLHDYKNQQLQANTQGTAVFNSSVFTGDAYLNFILGDASNFNQLQFLYGKHWVNNNYGFYANDNWHLTPRLTLNLGLRFDGLPHAFERYNLFANFVPADYDASLGNPVTAAGTLQPSSLSTFPGPGYWSGEQFYLNGIREAGVNGFPRGNVQNTYDTWQPRVGFAYDLTGNGKTVVRGGFGMFFERVQGNDVYNAALNPPFAYIPSANNVYFSNPNTSALTGVTTTQSFPSNLTNIKFNYPPPGTADYSFGLQRELAPSVVAVVQYVGSDGWDQNDDRQVNTLPLVDSSGSFATREGVANGTLNANGYRNFPGFSNINQEENETNFNYNSLQAGIRMESRHGLTTQVAYTWSHNISEVTNDLGGLSDPYNPKYDRASDTGFDRRHNFNVSYVYALPFFTKSSNLAAREILGGWEISGITAASSGLPQYITYTGNDTLGLGGGTTNRPNKVSSVSYPKKVGAWFSASSFADPVAPWNGGPNQGFGNAGRDSVVGPGLFNWNLSLFKTIPLTSHEGPRIELRFESFNTFNHTEFQNLDTNSHDGNFGAVTGDYGPRLLELGGKFVF